MNFRYFIILVYTSSLYCINYEVKSHSGIVLGIESNKVISWEDIPYAQAPVDNLRWKAPRNIEITGNELDASQLPNHCVQVSNFYDEIYDIDISEGHYRASVEVLLAWEDPKTEEFLAKFGDEIIHGEKLDKYLHEIWYPEFFVSNASSPDADSNKFKVVFCSNLKF